ncbi:hypothetical protein BaRGS_00031283, partial [Batillaria attramentaria]
RNQNVSTPIKNLVSESGGRREKGKARSPDIDEKSAGKLVIAGDGLRSVMAPRHVGNSSRMLSFGSPFHSGGVVHVQFSLLRQSPARTMTSLRVGPSKGW